MHMCPVYIQVSIHTKTIKVVKVKSTHQFTHVLLQKNYQKIYKHTYELNQSNLTLFMIVIRTSP